MGADEFTEQAFDKALKLEVIQLASFVFDVRRCSLKGKTHRVHTDVVLYANDGLALRSSFAYCTCSKGRVTPDRVCLCEHVLAVYLNINEEGDIYEREEQEADDPGGSPDADLGRQGEGLREPEL